MTQEPNAQLLQKPLLRYWLATRPGFLAASIVPAFLGVAAAAQQGILPHWGLFLWTLIGIMLVHAGVNVLNDYYDEKNGTDRCNTQRVFPFTGGSRFIQNGVFSEMETLLFGTLLLSVAMFIGLWLAWESGTRLLWIGAIGLALGWGYSAPPLSLNSRGLGEPAVAIGFGVLIPLGAWFVQTGEMAGYPVLISLPLSLLLMNILVINQFPDRAADAACGKHHWVVRLGVEKAAKGYRYVVLTAGLLLLVLIVTGIVPWIAIFSALPLGMAWQASTLLLRNVHQPQRLEPAIKLTIGSAVLHGVLLSVGLGFMAH